MGRATGGSNTSQWIRDDIPDFLRAMSMKVWIRNGKICNQTKMRKRLERFGEACRQ